MFTVYLKSGPPAWILDGGTVTYGGLDTTNCGEVIAYHPLSSATYFQYRASISFNGTSWKVYFMPFIRHKFKNLDVMSSTGMGMIGAPPEAARVIIDIVGAEFNPYEDLYLVACNATLPDLIVTIGSQDYAIGTGNMIEPVS